MNLLAKQAGQYQCKIKKAEKHIEKRSFEKEWLTKVRVHWSRCSIDALAVKSKGDYIISNGSEDLLAHLKDLGSR
jgi:hypothetical protein